MVYSREYGREIELTLEFSDVNPLIPSEMLYEWEMRNIRTFNRLYGEKVGNFIPNPLDNRGKTKLSVRHGARDKKTLERGRGINLGRKSFCFRVEVFWLEKEGRDRVISKMKESNDGCYLFAKTDKTNKTMNAKPYKIWVIDENVDYLKRSDNNRRKINSAERAKQRLKGSPLFFYPSFLDGK